MKTVQSVPTAGAAAPVDAVHRVVAQAALLFQVGGSRRDERPVVFLSDRIGELLALAESAQGAVVVAEEDGAGHAARIQARSQHDIGL
jgi:hypothetical protein